MVPSSSNTTLQNLQSSPNEHNSRSLGGTWVAAVGNSIKYALFPWVGTPIASREQGTHALVWSLFNDNLWRSYNLQYIANQHGIHGSYPTPTQFSQFSPHSLNNEIPYSRKRYLDLDENEMQPSARRKPNISDSSEDSKEEPVATISRHIITNRPPTFESPSSLDVDFGILSSPRISSPKFPGLSSQSNKRNSNLDLSSNWGLGPGRETLPSPADELGKRVLAAMRSLGSGSSPLTESPNSKLPSRETEEAKIAGKRRESLFTGEESPKTPSSSPTGTFDLWHPNTNYYFRFCSKSGHSRGSDPSNSTNPFWINCAHVRGCSSTEKFGSLHQFGLLWGICRWIWPSKAGPLAASVNGTQNSSKKRGPHNYEVLVFWLTVYWSLQVRFVPITEWLGRTLRTDLQQFWRSFALKEDNYYASLTRFFLAWQ